MVKQSKHKHRLFIAVVLLVLLGSTAPLSLAPSVRAAELTSKEKGLLILNKVVDLKLSKYAVTPTEENPDSYLGILPQENIRFALKSNISTIDMLCTFANGTLRMMHVLESSGSPSLTKPAVDMLGMAKDLLSNYQNYSKNTFYAELESILDKVDAGKDSVSTSGNMKLEASFSGGSATFRWTYTVNGFEASDKCVVLGYENGFLKYFIDNWDLYKVGSTSVNLSEKEAIEIAMSRAKSYSWKIGSDNNTFEVKNFNVTNAMVWQRIFSNSLYADEARGNDLLMLYPMYHIWVSLDKFYPGNVYGIEVYVWADTKAVCHVQERFSTLDPPNDQIATIDDVAARPSSNQISIYGAQPNSVMIAWLALPPLAAVTLGIALICFGRKKNSSRSYHLPKLRFFKLGGVLLCLLVLSTILLAGVSNVNATHYNGQATIWGAESVGDTSYNGTSGRKTQNETQQQEATAQNITSSFISNGYNALDYQGSGSLKYAILGNISSNEANYARVAVVDFDHGVGRNDSLNDSGKWHYMIEDNVGSITGQNPNGADPNNWVNSHMVYDMDIYNKTTGKTFFAFINTCMSANVTQWVYQGGVGPRPAQGMNGSNAVGMPFAWTHKLVGTNSTSQPAGNMSGNGYLYPDGGDFCYIGFTYGSAALNQTIQSGSLVGHHTWVESFFAYALKDDLSIIQALDHASYALFNRGFGDTDLYKGFNASWPMWDNYTQKWSNNTFPDSHLVIYGNGNIHLYEYTLSVSAFDDVGNMLYPTFYVDGNDVGTSGSSLKLLPSPITHTFNVTVPSGYTFDHFRFDYGTGWTDIYYQPVQLQINHNSTLTAYYYLGWSDNFDDNTRDTTKWDTLAFNGGSVAEANSQLQVSIPSGGSGQAGAGYVTTNTQNINGFTATININEHDSIGEMTLQICTAKVTGSDPFWQSDWYRIDKYLTNQNTYIQRKISGTQVTLSQTSWASATGQMKISVANGNINLYENGVLKWTDPYQLPTSNVYIYVFTSSARPSDGYGTDSFDNFAYLPTINPPESAEDFTTYTQIDPNNHINLAGTNHVDNTVRRNEDACLYKDKGAGYFTDFEHRVDVKLSTTAVDGAYTSIWALSNDIDDSYSLWNNHKTELDILFYRIGAVRYLYLCEVHDRVCYPQNYAVSTNTWYYLTITKAGTAFTCSVYSDAARTNLLTTLSATLHGNWSFQYIFATNSYNDGTTYQTDCDIENLHLP